MNPYPYLQVERNCNENRFTRKGFGFVGVPTRGFVLAKLGFCDRGKAPEFFHHPPLHPKSGRGATFTEELS